MENKEIKEKLLEVIDEARYFVKGKSLNTLEDIVNGYTKKEYPTKPGKVSINSIKSTGETAYQRAIFLSKKTTLNSMGDVIWNDLELPVVFSSSSRRRCVDLIGTLTNNNTPVLCELKFTSSDKYRSNSPIYAIVELLIYYYLIKDNCEALDEEKVFHKDIHVKPFEWSNFNANSIFIVGANKKYWDYWCKRYKGQKNKIDSWLNSLPIKVRLFSSDDFDFKAQKGKKEGYKPSVPNKAEWTEVFL